MSAAPSGTPPNERAVSPPRAGNARYLWIIGLALVLTAPSLWAGLWSDDIPQGAYLVRWIAGGESGPWWDIFHLQTGDPARRFGGVTPWWTVDGLRVQFFRPLTALTHLVDYWLWPTRPGLMHAHSMAYFALLVGGVVRLYREAETDSRVAVVAAVVFCASYSHASSVGWIANRNAVLAAMFGVFSIVLYRRWRMTGARAGVLCIPLLAASLLSAEVGVSTLAYVVAFEMVTGRQHQKRRWPKLASLLLTVAVWRTLYNLAGFGAFGSGAYIDPVHDPMLFASILPGRVLWLLGFLLAPARLLVADPLSSTMVLAVAALFGVAALSLVVAAFRSGRANAFWLTGLGLALVPLVASLPGERLLTFALIGLGPIVARMLVGAVDATGVMRKAFAVSVAACHLLLSPLLLLAGSADHSYSLRESQRVMPGLAIGSDNEVRGRSLVVLRVPSHVLVHGLAGARLAARKQSPSFTWVLGVSPTQVAIERRGCCTLVYDAPDGLAKEPFAATYRGPQTPLAPGVVAKTLAFDATVIEVDSDGFATRVRFDFNDRLDSGRMVFIEWAGDDFRRVDIATL